MTAFQQRLVNGIGVTDEIRKLLPEFGFLGSTAGGGLMVQFMNRPDDGILWVRREVIRTVVWGGDPGKSSNDSPETGRISPRKSFSAWNEIQRGRSLPWSSLDIEASRGLQRAITSVLLNRAEAELAQLSEYDPLTELPNRRLLLTQLAAWRESGTQVPACLLQRCHAGREHRNRSRDPVSS
jgi:light-regulated signal transduction histidine kinase (bacteriophytochrome)